MEESNSESSVMSWSTLVGGDCVRGGRGDGLEGEAEEGKAEGPAPWKEEKQYCSKSVRQLRECLTWLACECVEWYFA